MPLSRLCVRMMACNCRLCPRVGRQSENLWYGAGLRPAGFSALCSQYGGVSTASLLPRFSYTW